MQQERPTVNNGHIQTIDLLEYLQVLAKYKKMIVRTTLVITFITALITLVLPKEYSSTTKILPPQQDQGIISMIMGQAGAGVSSLASDLLGTGKPADLYAAILESDEIKDRIIDRFKLMEVYGENYRVDAYRTVKKRVKVEPGKKDGIISITVEDRDPKRAADIANAYVEEVGKLTINLNITGATQSKAFIEERLAKAKVDLANAEKKMTAFQSKNKTLDISEQSKGTIKGVAELMGQLAVQEIQLATLQRSRTESSQEVKNMKASIANLKTQIARLEGTGSGSSSIPLVGSIPAIGQEYVRLMREFKIQETLVELFTKQYEIFKFTEANNVANIQVIQKGRVPDKRIKPKRTMTVAIAAMGGFMIAVLFAFFLEFLAGIRPEKREVLQQTLRKLFALKGSI